MSKNKIVMVYRSKSGFTKNYATWIAKELDCDLLERSKVSITDLLHYDTIIYGGGLYAGGIGGVKLITKNLEKLKDKKLIVFAVGATPNRKETTKELFEMNIPANARSYVQFFYLRGGFDFSRLDLFNKFLMTLMKIKIKATKNQTADQKGMLASYSHPLDLTNIKNIEPLIKCARL